MSALSDEQTPRDPRSPVRTLPGEDEDARPEHGWALCLSGGGYRAMVFHVGVIWRLWEAGLLSRLKRISSVSGGSITAGVLALGWQDVTRAGGRPAFEKSFVAPICGLAGKTIDVRSIALGLLPAGDTGGRIARAYDRHLFNGATLQDLPDEPRFVINATNTQSGALWRFMKPYMRDYRVGEVRRPTLSLADAVAASSAFPPFLSPFRMRLDPSAFTAGSGSDLQREPFTSKVLLTDGGVYDNLGLETAWKRYDTILVSDAGGKLAPDGAPKSDWPRHVLRVLNLVDNQVRSLRKRQVIDSYRADPAEPRHRQGAYWGIRTNIADYGLPDALDCPYERTLELANTPTRLRCLEPDLQRRLINWGFAVCDAALRKHVDPSLKRPAFPYPSDPV